MAFVPQFSVSARLLHDLEAIAELKAKIAHATVQVTWVPQLAKDSRQRGAHASTAIEGNPLSLHEVRALEERVPPPATASRSQREVLNYYAGLRWVKRQAQTASRRKVNHEDLFRLHALLVTGVMDQGDAGCYRTIAVKVGRHHPPPPDMVSGLMRELLEWWNGPAKDWSPVLTSAILHYQFEEIHPFADGNGRTGRMLALWELFQRGFDTHHIFSIDEFYWVNRSRYYEQLAAVPGSSGNLTAWLEYTTEGLRLTLERVWLRVQEFSAKTAGKKTVLKPSHEELLALLRDRPNGMAPAELWRALSVTKQGALHILGPLLKSNLVKRVGTRKSGRYLLA